MANYLEIMENPNYSEIMEKVKRAIRDGNTECAQALATMAVADRLDRLCEIMSSKGNNNRPRW